MKKQFLLKLFFGVFIGLISIIISISIENTTLINTGINKSESIYVACLYLNLLLYVALVATPQRIQRSSLIVLFKSIIIIMYLIAILIGHNSGNFTSKSSHLIFLLPIFAFGFMYSVINRIKSTDFILILMGLSFVYLTVRYMSLTQERMLIENLEETTNTSAYYLLYFSPILFCFKKGWLRSLGFIIISIIILSAAKRGGFIALSLAVCVYFYINRVLIARQGNKSVRSIIAILIIFILGYFVMTKLAESDSLIFRRLLVAQETGGNGRIDIFSQVLNMIFNSRFFYFLFGHGFNMVEVDSSFHLSAHNDFLEMMYDYGIFLFIAYVVLHIMLIRQILIMCKQKSRYAAPMAYSYAIFFVNSNVSHIMIYPIYLVIYSIVWGTILSLHKREQEEFPHCLK